MAGDGCREDVPFRQGKSSPEGSESFGPFGCNPIVSTVNGFRGFNVVLHGAIVSEISDKELESGSPISCCSIKNGSIVVFSHCDGKRRGTNDAKVYVDERL